jgi:alpha-galactosidase
MRRSWAAAAGLAAALLIALLVPGPAAPTEHATGGPPPLGWSSWSFLRQHPTAAAIEAQATAMKTSGLEAAGYRYINLDDFWMACGSNGQQVDGYGRWIPDPVTFPAGIAAVASAVHADGLKFGLYVTPGIPATAVRRNTPIQGTNRTADQIADPSVAEANYDCGHMDGINYAAPGAQQFINSWADEFAAWGVDYVKLDGVGTWDIPDIRAWSQALRQAGRPMILELSSNLARADAAQWSALADGWRTGPDIECYACEPSDSSYPLTDWANVAARFNTVAAWQPDGGPHGWNDEDSLEIGNGASDGLTMPERQTMLALWSLAGAPLIIGADLTHLDPADRALLENRAVLAVDQDRTAADRVLVDGSEQVFAKFDPNGTWFIGIFNTGTASRQTFRVRLSQFGIDRPVRVTDLWTGRPAGTVSGSYTTTVAPGGVTLISASPA